MQRGRVAKLVASGPELVREKKTGALQRALNAAAADIYIMVKCLFVCHEKSTLPPGSLL